MDILPPLDHLPVNPVDYPQIPTRTLPATLHKLLGFCVGGEIQRFCEILDSQCSRPEKIDKYDLSAIMIEAIKLNRLQFIRELLHRGLPMDSLYAIEAIKLKAKDAIEVFLDNGWDINQPMSELKPPVLGFAVTDEEMTAWLLDHGADPNRQCFIDLTPLSLAVESGPISVIHLILSRGGNVQKGQLLHHAIERNLDTIEVLKLLIERGAQVNATVSEDYPSWVLFHFMGLGTPLHKASGLGKADVVRYLISEGACQSIKDAKGRIPLECAQISHQREVIEILGMEK
ncbi:unnamed protein product [Penicillium salamii]|nr:unnamed protein product [Penicillium salamii]